MVMKGLSKKEYLLMRSVNFKYNRYYCYKQLKTKKQILDLIKKDRLINFYDTLSEEWGIFYKGKNIDDSCS